MDGRFLANKIANKAAAEGTKKATEGSGFAIDPGSAFGQVKELAKPVTDFVGGVVDKIRAPRQQAIDIVARQLDLSGGKDKDFQETAKTALDFVLPDVTDLVPGGKIGGMAVKMGIKEAGAAKKIGTTAAHIYEEAKKGDKGFGIVADASKIAGAGSKKAAIETTKTTAHAVEEAAKLKAPLGSVILPPIKEDPFAKGAAEYIERQKTREMFKALEKAKK